MLVRQKMSKTSRVYDAWAYRALEVVDAGADDIGDQVCGGWDNLSSCNRKMPQLVMTNHLTSSPLPHLRAMFTRTLSKVFQYILFYASS